MSESTPPGSWSRRSFIACSLVNDALPSPLLRVQRGETFSARMENGIEDPLVLHWHGLTAPEDMDGHTPASRFPPGPTTDYRFEVSDPAGTCWYTTPTPTT